MSVAPGDCNPTRAVCRFIAQSRAGTGSFCGSVKGRPASLYVGWVSEAHPPRQTILLNNGLSPLARGTRLCPADSASGSGFIPARAGNTVLPPLVAVSTTVYPRSRGEHFFRRMGQFSQTVYPRSRGEHSESFPTSGGFIGLSPLARGTRAGQIPRRENWRFIPARAGNTFPSHLACRPKTVYPRSRGEHRAVRPEPL